MTLVPMLLRRKLGDVELYGVIMSYARIKN